MKIKTLIGENGSKARDPYVLNYGEKFYHCFSRDGKIYLAVAESLEGLGEAEEIAVYENGEGLQELWAPELHVINDQCYIYVAADDGRNENHRMYVFGNDTRDPLGKYRNFGVVRGTEGEWAIDGTVMRYSGDQFFVWSGCEGDIREKQEIFIAKMESPVAIVGERVKISTPEFEWEKRGGDGVRLPYVNEGPAVLERAGRVYLVYSASGCWCADYCLGMLELVGNDPLRKEAWRKYERPIFASKDGVVGPGHCSFVEEDGEQVMVFHSFNDRENLDLANVGVRCVRVEDIFKSLDLGKFIV